MEKIKKLKKLKKIKFFHEKIKGEFINFFWVFFIFLSCFRKIQLLNVRYKLI